ncbi:ATP-dependent DNA ligase clustered with Ku protein, LigD [Rhodococcus sp. B7740]|uniref:ATP-dependent DNA ligase n=1 Tax=Rhodococcus sp. B7740 TaxID=1564114 RepID=UPI0005D95EFD|nr:ATP-dependent DNA ligase [Rhodococcus sp. B7740]AJW41408.1 ATP-dependent DNA ligase clustered with Ku protein, LigD [Rhodococcus sp. B7740]
MATLEIDGRKVSVTNLDKVLFPETGTTKGNIIEYYVAIAPAMLPHLVGRAVTRKRWPNGVDQSSFFEKNLAASAPDWLDRRSMQHSDRVVTYPLFSTAADLAWLGQQAAIEAHVPQWRFDGTEAGPATRMVFDLDPGDDVDLARCAEVACEIRDLIGDIGMTAYPVTSGSKGIHLYVPLEKPLSTSGASTVAKRVATLLEERSPDRVTATMAKAKRTGRVFVDWSQNNGKKTTVAPYSLRGRALPTVAAPRTWDELEASGLQQLRFEEVLERFQDLGDLLAELDPTVDSAPESSSATDKLVKYRSMRSADKTPEPIPTATEPQGNNDTFVIQEHHARRLHYDFRLEHDGVLVSWAVPKNIPVDPKQNRLAVHTEDHPLEYASFSGRIPKGEYGGGDVSIWDSGTYELEKWREDEVIVVLHGKKATGRFALIRTKGNQWLMHLMKDAPDKPEPKNISPMLATAGDILDLPDDEWSFEGKWDGFRIIAELTHGSMTLRTRSGNDYTKKFGALQSFADDLAEHDAIVDGEVVVFDDDGVSSFEKLQNATRDQIRFIAFDLLHLDGTSLLRKKYSDRRRLLELLTTGLDSVLVPPRLTGTAADAIAESRERGWEGVVAKRTDSVYQPGKRAHTWIKHKNRRTQEIVIGGWRRGQGRRSGGFGSLLMGIPDGDGLRYVGRVGTGFDDRALDTLAALLAPLEASDSPFSSVLPAADRNGAVWVEPVLVGEVRYYEATESGHLRHPSWRGLRPDKEPKAVHRE